MERQLKERLIGASVLVVAAVLLVPEMFSGPPPRVADHGALGLGVASGHTSGQLGSQASNQLGNNQASSEQIKTYRLDLQAPPAGASGDPPVDTAPIAIDTASASAASQATITANSAVNADTSVETSSVGSISRENSAPPVIARFNAAPHAEKSSTASSAIAPPKSSQGEWVVQIGSFGTQSKAQEIAHKLVMQGQQAFVGPVVAGGKTLYRVRVGPLAERDTADAALKTLKGEYPAASVMPR